MDRRAFAAIEPLDSQVVTLTIGQLRHIVFQASVAYHDALRQGCSLQEAEWMRLGTLLAEVRRSLPCPDRSPSA